MSPAAQNAPFPPPEGAVCQELTPDDPRRSFLRMVSHELRTPLNSILGFSEILATELYGPLGAPQYKEYAEIIRGSGQKLLKLVNQVLEIARLQNGAAEFDLRAEPLDTAFEDVTAALADEAAACGVRIAAGRADGLQALADARALRTVLNNLLQNAIAFSPEGGEVRLSARRNGATVQICVEDDGCGVEPAELPRLLRPFEQGGSTLTRETEGAGLGLPISELICQAMGGRLSLRSEPGRGLIAEIQLRSV